MSSSVVIRLSFLLFNEKEVPRMVASGFQSLLVGTEKTLNTIGAHPIYEDDTLLSRFARVIVNIMSGQSDLNTFASENRLFKITFSNFKMFSSSAPQLTIDIDREGKPFCREMA